MTRKKYSTNNLPSLPAANMDDQPSEDGNSFTIVSYHKKKPGTAPVAHARATAATLTTGTGKGKINGSTGGGSGKPHTLSPVRTRSSSNKNGVLVTISTFGAFHYRIYPLIQGIVSRYKALDNPFIRQWQKITTQNSFKVTESSSLRTVSKALGINDMDLNGYRNFIESCPTIEEYVTITDATVSNGFIYYIHPQHNKYGEVVKQQGTLGRHTSPTMLSDNTNQLMTTTVNHTTPSLTSETQQDAIDTEPDDIDNEPDDDEIKDPVATTITDEATETTVTTVGTTLTVPKTSDDFVSGLGQPSEYNLATCYNTTVDFTEMMHVFWPTIQAFLQHNPLHEHSKQWNMWIAAGYTPNTDIAQAKRIMGLPTLDRIYLFLRDSPALQDVFHITWDHKIQYRQKDILETPTRNNMHKSDKYKSGIIDFTHLNDTFPPFHQCVFDLLQTSNDMPLYQCDTWHGWLCDGLATDNTLDEIYSILQITSVHAYINIMHQFPVINTRLKVTWTEAKDRFHYEVIVVTPIPPKVRHNLTLPTLHPPTIAAANHSHFASIDTRITNLEQQLLTSDTLRHYTKAEEINHSIKSLIHEELRSLDTALKQKSQYFLSQMDHTINTLIKDVYAAADDGHTAMKEETAKMREDIANMKGETAKIMEQFVQHTTVITDFAPCMEELRKISAQLQECNATTLHPSPNHTTDARSVCSQPNTNTSQPTVAARWTNWVKGPGSTTRWTHNRAENIPKPRFDEPTPVQDDGAHLKHKEHATSPPSASKNLCEQQTNCPIPHTVHTHIDTNELPPVNHDAAIKRAKIQYTGIGDLFVFYTQLLNGMDQFGIYLSPLDMVRYQESVCPAKYNNRPITPHRYRTMASTLYQKLQSPDVVPLEHTAIRNIINRYAEHNDGYKVLYAMLELVHPALHQDTFLLPPKSTECNEDVHLYAQKFDGWLKYEAYANRPYSVRETVNLFLRELSPHFAPAVSRVRRLMDTWNQYDPNVPEPLKIDALPVTIERFLNEETNTNSPWIRRLHHNASPRKSGRQPPGRQQPGRPHNPTDDKTREKDPRVAKDCICRLCGSFGHDDNHCDFMAKWINASDAAKTVDAKLKEKLKDSYKQEQQRRRHRKLSKRVGIIRQMLDDGVHPDDVDNALAALPGILDSQDDISASDSDQSEGNPSATA